MDVYINNCKDFTASALFSQSKPFTGSISFSSSNEFSGSYHCTASETPIPRGANIGKGRKTNNALIYGGVAAASAMVVILHSFSLGGG
ncbi:hypothetical protein M9Y10_007431 [Tritrichomonas musculus]|uniref:Uncharacterized protein n=1 Tax=Tritrichomonas musculus TaxID=1915356 RepID=A0ABR2J1B1_9EUKA